MKIEITRALIKAFYAAVIQGVFVREEDARRRIELRIFKAQAKGRIKK